MEVFTVPVPGGTPGLRAEVTLRRFGPPDARPSAYVQAGLHGDEVPPMLAAHHLSALLERAERAGELRGTVMLAPACNPFALGQAVLGHQVGRFDLRDGRNFNRGFPFLGPEVADAVASRLGTDADTNVRTVRAALRDALGAREARAAADALKRVLLGCAVEADLVLDLHCGSEAVPHLYTLTPLADLFAPLAGLMGAQATLLATESGDDPFDEACSRPWRHLRDRFPACPLPLACAAATLELRGEADVSHDLARADAAAILLFLTLRGVVDGPPPAVPPAPAPVLLAAAEPVVAPASGILVFAAAPGAVLAAGQVVAEVVEPLSGAVHAVRTAGGGVLYTRTTARFVLAGARLGTVAGKDGKVRKGPLLSA